MHHALLRRVRVSALLLYWQAQETDFTVVNIDVELPERTYFDFVPNAIVRHLRPRAMQFAVTDTAWYGNGDGSEYLELLVRDSFLTSLKTCCLYVSRWSSSLLREFLMG